MCFLSHTPYRCEFCKAYKSWMFRPVVNMPRFWLPAFFMPTFFIIVFATVAILCASAGTGAAQEPELNYFRIGTGSPAGTYFPVGELLGGIISLPPGAAKCEPGGHCGVAGLIALAQDSAGSIANVAGVVSGQYDSGLVQADVVNDAFFGTGTFAEEGSHPNIRVIANLYTEAVHLIVRKGAGIKSVAGLKGKRVSVDTPLSGTRRDALLILDHFGIGPGDAEIVEFNLEQASDALLAGELDAFFVVTGFPSRGVVALAVKGAIDIVPIDGKAADRLRERHPFLLAATIPEGSYQGIGQIATLGVGAQWIVRADQDEQRVFEMTRALWHPTARETLDNGHPSAREIRAETALHGVTTPIHAGALRYYLESGMLE